MGLIIDTSIIVALEKGKLTPEVWGTYEQGYISPITLTELLIGVDRADNENRRIKRLAFIEHTYTRFTYYITFWRRRSTNICTNHP